MNIRCSSNSVIFFPQVPIQPPEVWIIYFGGVEVVEVGWEVELHSQFENEKLICDHDVKWEEKKH